MLKRLLKVLDDSVRCRTFPEKAKYVTLRSLIPALYKSWRGTDAHGHEYEFRTVAAVIERHIILTGVWEPETTKWIEDSLGPGDVAWDIGAHIGYDSLLAAKLVGGEGRVAAFEPNPGIAAQLRHNIELNGYDHIDVFEAGVVSDPDLDEVTLYFPDASNLHSGLSSLVSENLQSNRRTNIREVKCRTVYLPGLLEEGAIRRPNLVKIDVEGFETEVVRGLEKFLSDPGGPLSLILEVRAETGEKPEVVALLEQFGDYRVIERTAGHRYSDTAEEYDVLVRNF